MKALAQPPPEGLLASSWAKFDPVSGDWMPLYRHLDDVAAMAELVWDGWIPRDSKRIISEQFGGEELAKKVFIFSAAGHDIGKHSSAFIAKAPSLQSRMQSQGAYFLSIPPADAKNNPHGIYSGLSLIDWAASRNLAAGSCCIDQLATVIAGHHGSFARLTEQIGGNVYENEKKLHWHEERLTLWDRAQATAGLTAEDFGLLKSTKPKTPALLLLNGALIVADWLGSNSSYFAFHGRDSSSKRAATALRRLNFPQRWSPSVPESINNLFIERFRFPVMAKPRPVQLRAAELAQETTDPPLMIIEAPTGEGKTEAAMAAAEILAARFDKEGVVFALPTCATSDGMFPRVLDWLDNTLPEGTKSSAVLSHGKSQFNEDYEDLISESESIYHEVHDDNLEDRKVQAHWWLRGRKTNALSAFSVGTIDQVLFAALKAKHFTLRHLGLSDKVVILDEIHAADEYMSVYLDRVLEWLGAMKVPVIALSATLPASRRHQLALSYRKGIASQVSERKRAVEKAVAPIKDSKGYPLITVVNRTTVISEATQRSGRSFTIELESIGSDVDKHVQRVLEAYRAGGCVAVIHNTVARAQDTFERLKAEAPEAEIVLLHSRFLAFERRARERDLLEDLGPNQVEGRHAQIVVATQVIEQSLDIDFDVMFSDWAPLDLLLQRAGRLHRHAIHDVLRPLALARPRLVLTGSDCENLAGTTALEAPEFDRGSEFVYGRSLLLRTMATIGEFVDGKNRDLTVPDDVEALMLKVYGEDTAPPKNWETEWEIAEKERRDKIVEKIDSAKTFLLPRPINQILAEFVDTTEAPNESKAAAQVRDVEDSIEVIVIQQINNELCAVEWLPEFGGWPVDSTLGIEDDLAKAVARCTLSLPTWVGNGAMGDRLIEELEESGIASWQQSTWLKRQLPLVLDENLEAEVAGLLFAYSPELGMRVTLAD